MTSTRTATKKLAAIKMPAKRGTAIGMSAPKTKTKTKVLDNGYLDLIQAFPLGPIRSDAQLKQATEILADLVFNTDDLSPGQRDYKDALKILLAEAERVRYKQMQLAPAELIKLLMDEQELKQTDLAEDFGGKGYVSEFLHGRRSLSKEVAARLCKRFSLRPEALLPEFQR